MFLFISHLAFADASLLHEHLRLSLCIGEVVVLLCCKDWPVALVMSPSPVQALSTEVGSVFAPKDMEKFWEMSGFSVRKSGCVFPDLFCQRLHWMKLACLFLCLG